MILDFKGKIAARPWVRTLSEGIAQIFTRVLGTTVVIPATPRTLTGTWSDTTHFGSSWVDSTQISSTWNE